MATAKKAAAKRKTSAKKKPVKKKTARKKSVVKKTVTKKTATKKTATKKTAAKKTAAKKTATKTSNASASVDALDGLRVRMYRVGFGDFFLLTVPTKNGGVQHILIDCGVHAGNIGSMADCVADLIKVTDRKLALVIITHYHADHLSGFATQYAEFAQFEVGAVWITNRLDPEDRQSMAFRKQLVALANHLRLQLQLRLRLNLDDEEALSARQALAKVENALGVTGGSNDKALGLVTKGFKNRPPVYYYQAGDEPDLPPGLKGALTAQILGPSPKDSAGEFAASDNKAEQYLALAEGEFPEVEKFEPFERRWPAGAGDYWEGAFRPWTPRQLEANLHSAQPDVLAAAADAVDGTLNNQSLVVLFTCKGKKLLFVGDAQWGNWAYWLYGHGVKGKDPGISAAAREILGSIDFYKVGHHGSTNATPIPAVSAMPEKCVAMCSTETGFPSSKRTYGSIATKTEVPRINLMEALEERTKGKLVRSDWIAAGNAPENPEAHEQLDKLPSNFVAGDIYIDYVFPA